MTSLSVVIPVKDGERYLDELLAALERELVDQVLVIDSGSRDRSVAIARAAGADLLRIEPSEFGHGRTRNLGAEHTSGELIAFLTQDATPCPGWRSAVEEAFQLFDHVGAAYGPHLPRADTSPMIARELIEFFGGFSPDGQPQAQRVGDPTFLSNVNACYARACWEEIRFRDVPYSEDQAFGAEMLSSGWVKVYHPRAAVLHAHDYGWLEFMRRYFDEYRGLRDSVGHIEHLGLRSTARFVGASARADRRWMSAHGITGKEAARWTARSIAHHGGRRFFAALGSRSALLPAGLRRSLSLEKRDDTPLNSDLPELPPELLPTRPPELPPTRTIGPVIQKAEYAVPAQVMSEGPAPLLETPEGLADRRRLRIAMIIPTFTRGSGGHYTLFQLLSRLEQRGHVCSVWAHDYFGGFNSVWPGMLHHDINEYFAPIEGAVHIGFDDWRGADVVIATGWQTVHAALLLPGCHARAYIVNDHEPEFYPTSTESVLAADSYRHGLHCIAASRWLRDLLRERYDASADDFELAVDHDVYFPRSTVRRRDTVVYYARHSTMRRAVPFGLMALGELYRRRPDMRVVLFGTHEPVWATFPYEHVGVLTHDQLAVLYSQATVGLSLSLTNFSLAPKEMMACGLPTVELAGVSAESIFGEDGPIELADLAPARIADAMERLLADGSLWDQRSRAGIEFVAPMTWDHATDQVEAGLRHALRIRATPTIDVGP